MKFYLDDKLVRTSKTHAYTHALATNNSVISCHTSADQALKAKNRLLAQVRQNIENAEAAIKAIDAGRTTYLYRYGRESWKANITESREYYEKYITECKTGCDDISIRELEAR